MRYRALFFGGPLDGQERVLPYDTPYIKVRIYNTDQIVEYQRLVSFGVEVTLVYSVYDVEETMNRLWHHYTGGRYE